MRVGATAAGLRGGRHLRLRLAGRKADGRLPSQRYPKPRALARGDAAVDEVMGALFDESPQPGARANRLKRRYDPTGLFRDDFSITPPADEADSIPAGRGISS